MYFNVCTGDLGVNSLPFYTYRAHSHLFFHGCSRVFTASYTESVHYPYTCVGKKEMFRMLADPDGIHLMRAKGITPTQPDSPKDGVGLTHPLPVQNSSG
mmetsp:Transcript_77888/g.137313  ORF Transcript_77888/g.137313 Transcript_77888/m.137313 type:complete len:99 (-) Transcript_77888:397-693(-)